jgi:F0F1-type ATP synthase membrane subunit b/b'
MESKEMHADKTQQLKDLEKYMQELTADIAEMIEDATPEEKQLLQKKISSLATKIEQMK